MHNTLAMFRAISMMALLVQIVGCVGFVHIPGAGVETYCVADWVSEGALIKLEDGRLVKVNRLLGRSADCQRPQFPVKADVSPRAATP